MGLIAAVDGPSRKVYLNPALAVGGVLAFHPTADLYAAYKALRAADESVRPYNAFLKAEGNLPKGGGKFTPRFTMLLEGAKVVIPAGLTQINVTGELLTDDGSSPFDTSLVIGPCIINYQPAEAEIVQVSTSGNQYSLGEIAGASAQAVWQHQAAAQMIGRLAEVWARFGLDPTKPLTQGETSFTFGEIILAVSEQSGQVTVTRQP